MLARVARVIVFFAAVQILGGHWLALQSVAWVGMLANYSRGETLGAAIEKTFGGEHPCSLCKVVKSGLEQEQKQQLAKVIVKIEGVIAPAVAVPMPRVADWHYPPEAASGSHRTPAPPTPPPQRA